MSQATELFIRSYEEILSEVNRRAGRPTSFSFELDEAIRRDNTVKRHRTLLRYIRDVRHLLQHPKHQAPGHAVQITGAFLEEVQAVLNQLRNPPTASSVGVARREIRIAQPGDRLGEVAASMKRDGFSHLPILNERGAVIGVFNEAAVFDFLWADAETIVARDMVIEDVLPHCLIDADRTETFRFVRPGTPLDDLIAMFAAIASPTTRIGAAFVTASGSRAEPLQRLITPWDVLVAGRD